MDFPKSRGGYLCENKLSIKGRSRWRRYDMREVSAASGERWRKLLNSERVSTKVELDDNWLTPTIYFHFYTVPVIIQEKVYQK